MSTPSVPGAAPIPAATAPAARTVHRSDQTSTRGDMTPRHPQDSAGQDHTNAPAEIKFSNSLLATAVQWRIPLVLDRYREKLERVGSPLVTDPVARGQALKQARQIVQEVVGYLRGLRPIFDERRMQFSREVGVSRAASNIHPAESLRAAALLFETILGTVAELVPAADAPTMLPEIAVAINNSVLYRIREGATAYASFLLANIHEANMAERHRIAREIHDRVGHAASVAQRSLDLHQLYALHGQENAEQSLENAREALRETVDAIRAVTTDLHLSEPLEGLEKALLGHATSVTDTMVRVCVNGDEAWAPPHVLEEAFLVVREALRNAVSHGQAGKADVFIDIAPHELRATIDDDGVGFEPDEVSSASLSVGLASMRERAELLGGSVKVLSHVGWGTHVELKVPLSGRRDDF